MSSRVGTLFIMRFLDVEVVKVDTLLWTPYKIFVIRKQITLIE